jgi:hypothetical protein
MDSSFYVEYLSLALHAPLAAALRSCQQSASYKCQPTLNIFIVSPFEGFMLSD